MGWLSLVNLSIELYSVSYNATWDEIVRCYLLLIVYKWVNLPAILLTFISDCSTFSFCCNSDRISMITACKGCYYLISLSNLLVCVSSIWEIYTIKKFFLQDTSQLLIHFSNSRLHLQKIGNELFVASIYVMRVYIIWIYLHHIVLFCFRIRHFANVCVSASASWGNKKEISVLFYTHVMRISVVEVSVCVRESSMTFPKLKHAAWYSSFPVYIMKNVRLYLILTFRSPQLRYVPRGNIRLLCSNLSLITSKLLLLYYAHFPFAPAVS